MREREKLLFMVIVFLIAFYIPLGQSRVQSAILESFFMLQDYAQKHVLACLVPAFFIAGAIVFSIVIGLLMHFIFFREEEEKEATVLDPSPEEEDRRNLWQYGAFFSTMIFILIFAAWGKPVEPVGFFSAVYEIHWVLALFFLIVLAVILRLWFNKEEVTAWVDSTWGFAKLIFPLLVVGVMAAGFLPGRPGLDAGIIPDRYIAAWVGGNSLRANFAASVVGAFMYFATLTEVPILQGLLGSGMGKGPALSLPNMFIIRSVMGAKKTPGLHYPGGYYVCFDGRAFRGPRGLIYV